MRIFCYEGSLEGDDRSKRLGDPLNLVCSHNRSGLLNFIFNGASRARLVHVHAPVGSNVLEKKMKTTLLITTTLLFLSTQVHAEDFLEDRMYMGRKCSSWPEWEQRTAAWWDVCTDNGRVLEKRTETEFQKRLSPQELYNRAKVGCSDRECIGNNKVKILLKDPEIQKECRRYIKEFLDQCVDETYVRGKGTYNPLAWRLRIRLQRELQSMPPPLEAVGTSPQQQRAIQQEIQARQAAQARVPNSQNSTITGIGGSTSTSTGIGSSGRPGGVVLNGKVIGLSVFSDIVPGVEIENAVKELMEKTP
jgi:hypothetical protein